MNKKRLLLYLVFVVYQAAAFTFTYLVDGHMDLLCAGNNWGAEVETVRYDAGIGLLLKGDGKGGFSPVPVMRSGFYAPGNVKDLALLRSANDGYPLIAVANNNELLQLFAPAAVTSPSAP